MREPLKNYQVDLDDVWHVIQHDLTPLKEQIEQGVGFYSFKVVRCLAIPQKRKRSKLLTFFFLQAIKILLTHKTIKR